MEITEILLIAVGLSMDPYSASVCKGLATRKINIGHILSVGLWFGGFQLLMLTVGYLTGSTFSEAVGNLSSYISLILLLLIGANLIRAAYFDEEKKDKSYNIETMLPLALKKTYSGFFAGIALALSATGNTDITSDIGLVSGITALIAVFGINMGNIFGSKHQYYAKFAGGIIIIAAGALYFYHCMG